jgi:DNA (cytosine-5)-methyltransferase 1
MLKVGSLFAGIGGLEYGLEKAGGFETVWQVEIDPFCRKVLEKHWPDVKRYGDIRNCHGAFSDAGNARGEGESGEKRSQKEMSEPGRDDEDSERGAFADTECTHGKSVKTKSAEQESTGIRNLQTLEHVDLICGGFPCQPFSHPGKRKGVSDSRWLWPEFYRIIREVQPEWVIVENVPGLLSIDSGRVFIGILRNLNEIGYDAEWFTLRASDFGAPHRRERVFIVAHAKFERPIQRKSCEQSRPREGILEGSDSDASDTDREGLQRIEETGNLERGGQDRNELAGGYLGWDIPWIEVATRFCRVDDGLPVELDGLKLSKARHRVERLKSLGNAVVPQVAEHIGRIIMDYESKPKKEEK